MFKHSILFECLICNYTSTEIERSRRKRGSSSSECSSATAQSAIWDRRCVFRKNLPQFSHSSTRCLWSNQDTPSPLKRRKTTLSDSSRPSLEAEGEVDDEGWELESGSDVLLPLEPLALETKALPSSEAPYESAREPKLLLGKYSGRDNLVLCLATSNGLMYGFTRLNC